MPRVIRTPKVTRSTLRPYIDRLVQELKSPGPGPGPYLLEARLAVPPARYVVVIWSDWNDLEPEHRSDAILEAYKGAEGAQAVGEGLSASGMTPLEALVRGRLPSRVEP